MSKRASTAADDFFEGALGVAPAVFLKDIFEQRHYGPHRADERLRTAEVATMADIDYVLNHAAMSPEDIQIIQGGTALSRPRTFDRHGRVNVEYIYQQFTQGASFRIERIHLRLPLVAEFAAQLTAALAIEATANAYVSPESGDVLGAHYDGHDVLVLQCVGSKRWRLFAPRHDTPRLPRRLAQRFDPARHQPGELIEEASLAPGDVLYMPRGTMHHAAAEGDVSLHLAFGIRTPTWGELALRVLQSALDEDGVLSTAVPYAMRTNPAAADAAAAPAIVRALMAEGRLSQALGEYQRECRRPKTDPTRNWFSTHQQGLDATERVRAIVKERPRPSDSV